MPNLKPLHLSVLIFFLSLNYAFSQRFQEGYYIDREGNRQEIQIINKKWSTWNNENLTVLQNGQKKRIPMDQIREFGIDDELKFIRTSIRIDRSPNRPKDLDFHPEPNLVEEKVLLKVIVEGDLSLYLFLENNVKKFFIGTKGKEPEQLILKRYMEEVENKLVIKENVAFRKQLERLSTCGSTNFNKINYELGPLKKFVVNENACRSPGEEYFSSVEVKPRFSMNVRAGAFYSIAHVERAFNDFAVNAVSPTAAVELEYIIPAIRHEVGIKMNAMYHAFEVYDEIIFPYSSDPREISLSHAEIFFGPSVEYRYFLNNTSALSGGIGYYFPLLLEDSHYTETLSRLDKADRISTPFPGVFVTYGFNSFSLKLQAFVGSAILEDVNNFNVDLQRVSFTLGYFLF